MFKEAGSWAYFGEWLTNTKTSTVYEKEGNSWVERDAQNESPALKALFAYWM
jgi:hypothetical protein